MKRLALSLLLAAIAFVGAFSVLPTPVEAASDYPPRLPPNIIVDVPSVAPGGTFTVTVGNCEAGEQIIITFQGQQIIVVCDPGVLSASASFVAPSTPGTYTACAELTGIGATLPPGVTRPQTLCTSILVAAVGPTTPPPVTTPGGGLPATGSNGLGTTTTSAIILISAGALLLIVTQVRRRRTSAATAA